MDEEFRRGVDTAKSERQNAVEKEGHRRAIMVRTINEIYDRLAPTINSSKRLRIYKGAPHGYEGWSPLYIHSVEERWYGIRRTEKPTGAIKVHLYDGRDGNFFITISYGYVHVPGYKNSSGNYVIDENQDGATYFSSHSVDDFIFEFGRRS